MEWSTNLQDWATLSGAAQQNGATVAVSPGANPVQIVDAPVGRVSVHFTPAHEAAAGTNALSFPIDLSNGSVFFRLVYP